MEKQLIKLLLKSNSKSIKKNIDTIKQNAIAEYLEGIDKSSKFYQQDLDSFKQGLKGKSLGNLVTLVSRLRCLNGKSKIFNKMLAGIDQELENGGMFDVSNLKPENALD